MTQYCQCDKRALDELVPCGGGVGGEGGNNGITDLVTYPEVIYLGVTLPTSELASSLLTSFGRGKRDIDRNDNINYDYDPSDFDFAVDSLNELLFEWPTITGITEDMAAEYCIGGIQDTDVYRVCQNYVEGINEVVAKCVADVKVGYIQYNL